MLHTYTSVDKKVAERQRLASEFSSREAGLSRRRVKQKSTHKYKVYIMLARLRGRGRAGRGRAGRGKAVVGDGKLSTSLSLSLSLSLIYTTVTSRNSPPRVENSFIPTPPPPLWALSGIESRENQAVMTQDSRRLLERQGGGEAPIHIATHGRIIAQRTDACCHSSSRPGHDKPSAFGSIWRV